MTIERWVHAIAGLFVIASVALAHFVDARFLWFTAFVGANLLQSSFTRFCPLASVLRWLGAQAEGKPSFRA